MQTIKDLGKYTFPCLFNNSVKKFGSSKALSFVDTEPITYNELADMTEKVARLLASLGVKKGDKVAIYSTSTPNWAAAYFAIVNYGAIAVPLLPDFNEHEVKSILEHADVSGIFVASKMQSRVIMLADTILPFIINIDDFSVSRGKTLDLNQWQLNEVDVEEKDTASIIYTSGTTGCPKGVELTHKNLVWCAIQCQTVHRVNKRDKCLSFLPLSHVYEFTIGFVMMMLNGACVYYLGKPPTVTTLLPALKKIRPTIVLSVPIVMEKVYKNKIIPTFTKNEKIAKLYQKRFFQKIFHRIAGKSLKKSFGGRITFFGIGGAKLDKDCEQFLKDAKFNYAIGYGLTETSPLLAGSSPRNTKPGSIGPTMQGVTLKIINKDESTGIGEIVAKGENVMKGYYREDELTKATFTTKDDECGEGYFKTGDLGILDKKGRLWLKGRLKNMILGSSGENIYPEDIEFVLNQHPFVAESLVVEDEDGLTALVQLDEEKLNMKKITDDIMEELLYLKEHLLSEIKFFVNDKVNRFSKIKTITVIKEFEKTASQKIKRYLYNLKEKKDK
ncbi:MAG: long-chain fatty acid--CoA ligase [Treponema sp.]|nr:long-chain fatty acid--CoA ligase [Treponema sp.]